MLSPPHRKFPHKLFGPIVLAAMLNSSRGKPIAEIAAIQSFQPSRSRQIPIAPAAPPQRHPPRFRALALLGRRPPAQADGSSSRRPRNLHTFRHSPLTASSGRLGATRPRFLTLPHRWPRDRRAVSGRPIPAMERTAPIRDAITARATRTAAFIPGCCIPTIARTALRPAEAGITSARPRAGFQCLARAGPGISARRT